MKATDTQKLVYKMLKENTGVHFLDSGFENGRMWQRNANKTLKDFINEDEETYMFDQEHKDINRTVSVFHYLGGLQLDEICKSFNRRNTNCKDWEGDFSASKENVYGVSKRASNWLQENFEVKVQYTFNTYNNDSDLSQILQGSRLLINNETYYLIQIHGGADARGGYTDAKLFLANEWSGGIHEYLSEYKDNIELMEDLQQGYISKLTDCWNEKIKYSAEEVLKIINI
jgi:hypothetical protein